MGRLALLTAVAGAFLLPAPDPRAGEPVRSTPFAAHLAARQAQVHARPDAASRTIRVLTRFRRDYRPTVVAAIGRRTTGGRTWYRVRLTGRPNGRAGWIAAERLEWVRSTGRIRLVVDRARRRLSASSAFTGNTS